MGKGEGFSRLGVQRGIRNIFVSEYFILILSVLIFLIAWAVIPNIANGQSLMNMLDNILPLFIIVIGQMFVLMLGGIDLSQTSIVGITSVIGAIFMTNSCAEARFGGSVLWGRLIGPDGGPMANSPWATPVAILIMIIVGVGIGLLNGWLISRFNMQPFMVTLIIQQLFLSLGVWLTQSFNIVGLPESFVLIGRGKLFGTVPYSLFIAVIVGILALLLLRKTVFGKWIVATGENKSAAEISGVPTRKMYLLAYAISGLTCVIAAIIYSGRLQQGSPTLSKAMLMDIVGAAVIGGVSMFGGKGKLKYAIIGCIFFTLLSTVLNMLRLSTFVVDIVKGLFILVAALLDVIRIRMSQKTFVMDAQERQTEQAGTVCANGKE